MTPSFSARDASRPVRELLRKVTATAAWEGFPEEDLWSILERGGHSSLERSLKMERELLHPLRFHYYYRRQPGRALDQWLALHDAVRDRFPLPRVDPARRRDEIAQLVAGVDFRAEPRSSRFKLWFQTAGASELLQEALARTEIADAAHLRDPDSTILWGYDLGLDGSRTFKMYPRLCLEKKTGCEDLVVGSMPVPLRHLIPGCSRIYMGVREGEDGRSFHFLPRSVPDFLRRLGSEPLLRLVRDLQLEARTTIVSIAGFSGADATFDACALYYSDR